MRTAISSSPLLITANARLARELRHSYDMQQIDSGLVTWIAPDILPFSAWLDRCWREWLYSGKRTKPIQLLRPSQEMAIWEDIVGGSDEGRELLQVAATADAALDAWNLMCDWKPPLDASEWDDSSDTEAFRRWAREFQRQCESRSWLSRALLPDFIAAQLADGGIPAPADIVLAGFNEFTPAQELVLEVLRRKGCRFEVRESAEAGTARSAVRIGLKDTEGEIRAAAQWARRLFENAAKDGEFGRSVGIVVPDLSTYRSRIERIFAGEFHPNGQLFPERDSQRAFNISLGPPLYEYPLIQAAFLILQTRPSAIPLEDASLLLRSPFLGSAQTEYTHRALLDARLRGLREPEVAVSDIIGLGTTSTPALVQLFAQWMREWDRIPSRQMPSDWVASFSRFLVAMGWPGERPLNSAEYQTTEAWNDVLGEFASLDSSAGNLALGGALAMLQRLAVSRQFQPESEPAPIQILGVFEALGLEFDHLWIMGMHDGAWPRAASPNPFLPLRLQREKNMPQCTAQRELEFTRLLTEQLLGSAPFVVVSFPQREGDMDLRPSPLFSGLPEIGERELSLAAPNGYAEQVRRSSRMEVVEDHTAPPWDGSLRRGGTAIFKDQAACPFRAFAQHRLGAEALDVAQPGLSLLDRGTLIHGTIERIWSELRSHQGVVSAAADRLEAVVRNAVHKAVDEMASKKRALRQPRFAAIEQARLEHIMMEWLELEKQRKPFAVLRQEEERKVSVGGVDLRIRADRVDRLEDGTFVVIDYKSGKHSPSEWDGDRPDEPQLPLYAITAEAALSGVFFGVLKVGESRFSGLASSEGIVPKMKPGPKDIPLPEHIENWRLVLQQLAEDFRNGKAVVDPKNPQKTCAYCSLPGLCRIGAANRADDTQSEDASA